MVLLTELWCSILCTEIDTYYFTTVFLFFSFCFPYLHLLYGVDGVDVAQETERN